MNNREPVTDNVVLITVDCLRARNLRCYGYDYDTSPRIDNLATEGVTFERCYANAPFTSPSFPSILGSVYFNMYDGNRFPAEITPLAEAFGEAGYRTLGVNAANPNISSAYGYQHGFDKFVDFIRTYPGDENENRTNSEQKQNPKMRDRGLLEKHEVLYDLARRAYEIGDEQVLHPIRKIRNYAYFLYGKTPNAIGNPVCPSASTVVDVALRWLDDHDDDYPFFMWLHLMDPHSWYDPDPEYLTAVFDEDISRLTRFRANRAHHAGDDAARAHRETLQKLYDGTIREVDAAVGRLADSIDARGLDDETYLVITGDHGEEFFEHGGISHSDKLYEELLHVPLIVRGPEASRGTVTDPVQLLDLGPTLLELTDNSVPNEYLGADRSDGISDPETVEYSDPVVSATPKAGAYRLSVRDERFTYLTQADDDERLLFDREHDPKESIDVSSEFPDVVAEFGDVVEDHLDFVERRSLGDIGDSKDVSKKIEHRLESLGYK